MRRQRIRRRTATDRRRLRSGTAPRRGGRAGTALAGPRHGRFRRPRTRTRGAAPRPRAAMGTAGRRDGRDGGPRPRRKGSWWRHWTWKKALAVVGRAWPRALMLLFVALVVYAYEKTPIPTDVSEAALQQSSTVYFSNGKTRGHVQRRRHRPADAGLRPDPRGDEERHGRGGRPALLHRGRHLGHRHPALRLRGPQRRRQPAGRLHAHRAVRQELLHRRSAPRGPISTQDQGDLRRDQALAREVQGLDHHPVPEHGPVRRQRLRRRARPRRSTSTSPP